MGGLIDKEVWMRLTKLTLHGFKSFADRTEFVFDQPVTGVVGPNGCGKSNIVDAVKWVLGERSSKSLRGHEMIDVIFAGSAARKPMGMASVTLTFDNPVVSDGPVEGGSRAGDAGAEEQEAAEGVEQADEGAEGIIIQRGTKAGRRRGLPIDSDVVEVERRLFRDGTSKYVINGRSARLRDIRELFLDTGIGADAYSIIEQGKVDAMLLASPMERRTIFEEAAGIAKYKQRRIEAQRKLDKAEVNLNAAREQLESTERRLRIVKGQAAKARKFKELDENLRCWRLALAFEQYDDLRRRLDGLTSRQADLHGQREEAGALLADAELRKQESEVSRQELAGRFQSMEQDRLGAVHAQQQASQRKGMLERAHEEADRQAGMERARIAELTHRAGYTETAIADQRESLAAIAEQLAEAERQLAAAGAARAAILEELNDRRHAVSQKQSGVARIDRERIQLLASIQADLRRAESVREQIDRIADKAARNEADQQMLRQSASGSRGVIEQLTAEIADSETRSRELDAALSALSLDRRERAERVAGTDQELARLDSRRATLQELVDTRAGFEEAVRDVLHLKEEGKGFNGVIAPLADLVQTRADVDVQVAIAVEAALGGDLQGLVVESEGSLPPPGELEKLRGRVTFLPLRAISEREEGVACTVPGVETGDSRGMLVSLRELVSPREELEAGLTIGVAGLIERLMGRTFLVRDVDAATLLGAGPLRASGARFVTRDGMIVDGDGRVTAGPAGQADSQSGLLRRRTELEQLGLRVRALAERSSRERDELKQADAEAAGLSAKMGEINAQLAQRQRSVFTEQTRLERILADIARQERERTLLDQEGTQQQERLAKIDQDRRSLEERAEGLRRLQEEESRSATSLELTLRNVQTRADAAMDQLSSVKVQVGMLSEQSQSARREVSRLEVSRDDMTRQLREAGVHEQRLALRMQEHVRAIDECTATEALAGEQAAALTESCRLVQAELRVAGSACTQLAETLHASRRRFAEIERDWHSLEVAKREVEVKRETLEDRSQDELSLVLSAEYDEYRAMMEDGRVAKIDPPEAAREIDALREAIRKLGGVNLDAIGEEDHLEEQNTELIGQVADLDQARVQLKDLITRLNEVSRQQFGEVFAKIQENFGAQDGMFRRLFGGGKAEVRLMPLMKEVENADGTITKVETEETDLLESGIEVLAKPPGKEPRAISQLSGGEKTLTAVALLMSIFRSRPSCFCVLDEVDAALDEGNVARFNATIRQFTDLSSFIVITHNKRTMQNADKLFGVTMQERGVSTRVSVRFEEVGRNGEIKAPAGGEAEPPLIGVRRVGDVHAVSGNADAIR